LGSEAGDARNLVEALAALCRRRLKELRIYPDTDSTYFLGCFVQCDALRKERFAISKGLEALESALTKLLSGANHVCECLSDSVYRVKK
jgi:hypothetical protein